MLTCRDISKLVSESLDRDLPLRFRVELRLHLMMCGFCRAYKKQSLSLRKMLSLHDAVLVDDASSDIHLSAGAGERIKKALNDANE